VSAAAAEAEREQGPHGARVVRVFCEADNLPDLWVGEFGSALVERGPAGIVLSTGEHRTL